MTKKDRPYTETLMYLLEIHFEEELETGCKYIERHFKEHQYRLKRSPIFWNWWNDFWEQKSKKIMIDVGIEPFERRIEMTTYEALNASYDFHNKSFEQRPIIPPDILIRKMLNAQKPIKDVYEKPIQKRRVAKGVSSH